MLMLEMLELEMLETGMFEKLRLTEGVSSGD
jgi:hypothetical protein